MKKDYNDYFLDKAYSTPNPLVEDLAKNMKLAVTSGHSLFFESHCFGYMFRKLIAYLKSYSPEVPITDVYGRHFRRYPRSLII